MLGHRGQHLRVHALSRATPSERAQRDQRALASNTSLLPTPSPCRTRARAVPGAFALAVPARRRAELEPRSFGGVLTISAHTCAPGGNCSPALYRPHGFPSHELEKRNVKDTLPGVFRESG